MNTGQTYHPGFGVVRYETRSLSSDPDEAVTQTLQQMAAYATEDAADPAVRKLAAQLAHPNPATYAAAVFAMVQQLVTFRPDADTARAASIGGVPEQTEVLIRPVDLLQMRPPEGDCDDFAMLTAALLIAGNVPAAWAVIAADPQQPGSWTHVYTIALTSPPIALDTSHGDAPGWIYTGPTFRVAIFPIVVTGVRMLGTTDYFGNELPNLTPGQIGPGYTPPYVQQPIAQPWWQSLIQTGQQLAVAQWGQPKPGTYMQNGSSIFYRQQQGDHQIPHPVSAPSTVNLTAFGVMGIGALAILAIAFGGKK